MTNWVAITYGLVFPLIILVAAYALFLSYKNTKSDKAQANENVESSVEDFVTARGSQSKWNLAFSFYAGCIGSWIVTMPASYGSYAGLLGVVAYAVAAGIPILLMALFGSGMSDMFPKSRSLTHFVRQRFGIVAEIIVTCIAILNISLALLSEYTTVGGLFKDYLGSSSYPITITMGVLTMFYTMAGGLRVSILTDRVQAIMRLLLVVLMLVI